MMIEPGEHDHDNHDMGHLVQIPSFVIINEADNSFNSDAYGADYDPLNNSHNNVEDETSDYDPLGETMENRTETDPEAVSRNNESDSDDSIIELETEPCPLCRDNFSSKSDLIKHLAFCHFQAGLLKELHDLGWEDGGKVCPKCDDFVDQHMLVHWAEYHDKAQPFLKMFKEKEVKVEIKKEKKYCHEFIHKWFKVDVLMKNDNKIQHEIDQILNPPEEILEEEEEEDVIVLDDSSDDEIEILETVKNTDIPVEPILEKIEDDEVQLIDIPLDDDTPEEPQPKIEKSQNIHESNELVINNIPEETNHLPAISNHVIPLKNDLKSEDTGSKMLESASQVPKVEVNSITEAECKSSSNFTFISAKNENSSSQITNDIEAVLKDSNEEDIEAALKDSKEEDKLPDILSNKEIKRCKEEADTLKDFLNNKDVNSSKSPLTLPTLSGEEIATLLGPEKEDNNSDCQTSGNNKIKNDFDHFSNFQTNGDLLNNMIPIDANDNNKYPEEDDSSASSDDVMYYVQPKLTQCLECLEDQGTLSQLSSHMITKGHLNISWAAQTNVISDNGILRWYQKPSKYTCVICFQDTNASIYYNSIKTVLLHIIESHRRRFELEYVNTNSNQNFILCKICKSFLYFQNVGSEKSRRKKELAHYINNHGQVFLFSLNVIDIFNNKYKCKLCQETRNEYNELTDHLISSHAEVIIGKFRKFDLTQLEMAVRPSVCCICFQEDNHPDHLSQHDLEILSKIGLIEVSNQKVVCKCCHSVSVYSSRLINHFAQEHSNLFNFLTSKYLDFTKQSSKDADEGSTLVHCSNPGPSETPNNNSFEANSAATMTEINPEETAPAQVPVKSSGFENAFLSFVGSGIDRSKMVPEPDQRPEVKITNGKVNKKKVVHSPEKVIAENGSSDQQDAEDTCKICLKPFVRLNMKGEPKSNGIFKAEIKNHYLSHFRDKLVSKYPASFSGTPPLKCEKCGFVSKSTNIVSVKQIMLTHIASCQGELDMLIDSCSRKNSSVPAPKKHNLVLSNKKLNQANSTETTLSWKTSSVCLLCNANLSVETIKPYHYANHFKEKLINMFHLNETADYKCHYCGLTMKEDNNYALLRFIIHIGVSHDVFSDLLSQNNLNISHKDVTMGSKNIGGHENKENKLNGLLRSPESKSIVRTPKSFSAFVKEQEKNPTCIKCNQSGEDLTVLMKHLLRKHYQEAINIEITKYFPDFQRQEMIQGVVKCSDCGSTMLAVRSIVTDHLGIDHRVVLKHYFNDVKNKSELSSIDLEVEEFETDGVLNSLLEDLDNDNDEDYQKKERELLTKIQAYLEKAKVSQKNFIQFGPCYLIDPNLSPCHECQKIMSRREEVTTGSCCCFEGFRKLRFSSNNNLTVSGYLHPFSDPKKSDLTNWSMNEVVPSEDLDEKTAIFILSKVGSLMCSMVMEEKRFMERYVSSGRKVIWRRQHAGVREMCDVCSTTIFNYHLTCGTCGIMVCIDCYTARVSGTRYRSSGTSKPYRTRKRMTRSDHELDVNLWPLCIKREVHNLEHLLLTQMSPGNYISGVVTKYHNVLKCHNLKFCCNTEKKEYSGGLENSQSGTGGSLKRKLEDEKDDVEVKHKCIDKSQPTTDLQKDESQEAFSFVRMIESLYDPEDEESDEEQSMSSLISSWVDGDDSKLGVCQHFPLDKKGEDVGLDSLSPRHIMTHQESSLLSGSTKHSWLCDGSLLQLDDAISPYNMTLFQEQWARGQPVIISNSCENMNKNLWHPRAFLKDFGHLKLDLVNTKTGKKVPNQPVKWFWEGFEKVSHRLTDADGTPMLLKLKDWPAEDDIASYIPKRFHDLIHDFPIQSYTLREGNLNIASYIPDNFLKPELGPKMYIAYGNALYSNKASTNLHLDMSDAVNLLVHVSVPSDTNHEENIKLVLQQVDEAGCDISMKKRVRDEGKLPGALWHIYHPGDTTKIRDLLTKVAMENHRRLDPHDDPIHDQSTYLDAKMRSRLYSEYGVMGYAIIQCAGDTVFIPAGACHQVRNLHNCIKIAEDFVSPEMSKNCLHLTQEFRNLTEHHTNHEDKLQIKNIIFHSTRNAVAKLSSIIPKMNT